MLLLGKPTIGLVSIGKAVT